MLIAAICLVLVFFYPIAKHLLLTATIRSLVDNYGLDRKKLKSLTHHEISGLQKSIAALRKNHDAFGLEQLLRPYRP